MDTVKKFFPFAFKDTKTNNGLVVSILIHVLAAVVVTVLCTILNWIFSPIPVLCTLIGLLTGIVGWLVGVYATAGVVLAVLNRFGIIS